MKIIYIHQYFKTLKDWGGTRSYYLAKAMMNAGHEVHLITSHNDTKKKIEDVDGIKVYYLPLKYEQVYSPLRKLQAHIQFIFSSYGQAAKIKNVDLVYATSTPLTVGITAIMLKKRRRLKYIFEVRDLWPEVPIALGIIKNGLIKNILFDLTKRIYKNASAIVSLSPGITDGIKRYSLPTSIYELPNFADTNLFHPTLEDADLKKQYLPNGEFGIVHFGAIGRINHLDFFLDAAEASLKENLPLIFFIIGEGSEKDRLEKEKQSRGIKNLILIPPVPKEQINTWLSIMTFSYISVANIPVLSANSANKLYDSLAAGKICISNIEGWQQEMLEREQCGFNANPLKPEEFLQKIKPFLENETLRKTYSTNARSVAEREYSEIVIAARLIRLLEGL